MLLQVSCVDLSVEQDWNRPVRLVELGFVLAKVSSFDVRRLAARLLSLIDTYLQVVCVCLLTRWYLFTHRVIMAMKN